MAIVQTFRTLGNDSIPADARDTLSQVLVTYNPVVSYVSRTLDHRLDFANNSDCQKITLNWIHGEDRTVANLTLAGKPCVVIAGIADTPISQVNVISVPARGSVVIRVKFDGAPTSAVSGSVYLFGEPTN